MRVAVVSRADGTGGGAGRVAEDLVTGLRARDRTVDWFIRRGSRDDAKALHGISGDVGLRNLLGWDISGARLVRRLRRDRPDLVHFHDFSLAWGVHAAAKIAQFVPVVVTLHDYSGLSGGCLSPSGCERFSVGCGRCPQLGDWPIQLPFPDTSARTWARNHALASRENVRALAPSAFCATEAMRGAWRGREVHVVPNSVDLSTFHPKRRDTGRIELAVDDRPVLLMVAADLSRRNKGLNRLLAAMPQVLSVVPGAQLILVGSASKPIPALSEFGSSVRRLGPVNDRNLLGALYAAADVVVVPSWEETFALVCAEAQAAGTCVVATDAGPTAETFQDGVTGILVPQQGDGLGDGILSALRDLTDPGPRQTARRSAVEAFGPEPFLDAHEQHYATLLKASQRGS